MKQIGCTAFPPLAVAPLWRARLAPGRRLSMRRMAYSTTRETRRRTELAAEQLLSAGALCLGRRTRVRFVGQRWRIPMPVTELNHYFVRANDLERTKQCYVDVLGFEVMPRPDFPFPGYWLGVNGKIQVHMGPHGIPNSELYYLGTTPRSATDNTGVVDHIAFLATEPAAFAERFDAAGIAA